MKFLRNVFSILLLCSNGIYCSVNLSLNKTARQSSTLLDPFAWDAGRAVDGRLSQVVGYGECSVTNPEPSFVWWQVDLGQPSLVDTVTILLREDDGIISRARMAGYSLYISDIPDIQSGHLCYRHSGNDLPPSDIQQSCNLIGQYLTIYNMRNGTQPPTYSNDILLILCEVQASGCPYGTYGNLNCNTNCSENCINRTLCDPGSGACAGGCKTGFKEPNCDSVCDGGTYGPGCNFTCTSFCLNGPCDHVTGTCLDGICAAGFKGPTCSDACVDGTFGIGCNETCSEFCVHQPCNGVNGSCPFGECKIGYQGDNCDKVCDRGTYGPGCGSSCSSNCLNNTCDHINGACTTCTSGKTGFNCTEDCTPGTYGLSCRQTCSVNCLYQPCNSINGSCLLGRCHDGWTGEMCTEECTAGYYGNNCSNTCGNCANGASCNHVTGNCPGVIPRCRVGWKGEQCKSECEENEFGADCTGRCGQCVNVTTCNPLNGSCPYGCKDGWTGLNCDINTAALGGQEGPGLQNAGIIVGASAAVFVLIMAVVVIAVLRRKSQGNKNGYIRRKKSSYVPFDEDNASIASPGSRRLKRRSRGDNLDIGFGKEGTGHIAEDHKHLSHYICDLYAVVDKPKSIKEKHIVVIRNKENGDASKSQDVKTSETNVGIPDDNNIYNEADDFSPRNVPEEDIYAEMDDEIPSKSTENLLDSGENRSSVENTKIPANENIQMPYEQNPYFDMSESVSKTAIKLEDMKTVIYKKLTDRTFDSEFQAKMTVSDVRDIVKVDREGIGVAKEKYSQRSLPEGDLHPTEIGASSTNKAKNRFASVLPYDHSRVVLEPLQGDAEKSDYINANYIDGVTDPHVYIATQGPKKSTIRDFWKMVWQKQVGKIVMVTDFIEAGKVKCAKYWLEPGVNMKISIYIVTVEEEREYAYYTFRKIKLVETQTKKVRRILHFHFTMWPDHGTPDPLQLVLFRQKVSNSTTRLMGPMVVHCSAGLGRTGTFIGLDALLTSGWKTGLVDIYEYVKKIRQNRTNMVATADQYFIIHRALLEGFRLEDTKIHKDVFLKTWEEMQKTDTPANRKKIRDEFQKLDYLRPDYDESMFAAAHNVENIIKNRSIGVLPVDRYRPFLTTPVSGRNDYINAIMIPSFVKPVGFIVTQFPLPGTIVDVWRLLYDHDSDVIISLGAIDNDQQSTSVVPGSSSEPCSSGPFVVNQRGKKNVSRDIIELDIEITNKERKMDKKVKVYEVKTWKAGEYFPPNRNTMICLAELTEQKRKHVTAGPITIMCPDGAICSGILCAFFHSVEQVTIDDEIDLFQTVRQLNVRRPQFIQRRDQYSYCYDLVKEYLFPRDMYANT